MKVAGFVGKCERTAGSQQGDIIACRVATMREVTRVRPHWKRLRGTVRLFYIPQIPWLQFVCLHCVFAFICAHGRVFVCATAYSLFVYYAIMSVRFLACAWVYSCLHLSSQRSVHKMNHLPHKSKALTEAFFIWLRDYIIWLCVLCTHLHTHKLGLQMEGGTIHTHTHHTLTVSLLLTQTHFEHVQTDRQCRRTHSLATPPPPTPTVASKLDPTCPRAERQKDIERDQWTQWCVCYLHPNPQFSLSLPLCLHPPFSWFQAANSAVCQLLSQSCEYTCKHSFHLYLLRSPSDTRALHAGHLRSDAYKLFLMSNKLKK